MSRPAALAAVWRSLFGDGAIRRLTSALLLLLATGCGKRLETNECQLLLDHYVELLLRDDRPKSSAGEILRLQQEARKKAERDPAFHECSARVSRQGFDCAMDAEDANRLEQCLL